MLRLFGCFWAVPPRATASMRAPPPLVPVESSSGISVRGAVGAENGHGREDRGAQAGGKKIS